MAVLAEALQQCEIFDSLVAQQLEPIARMTDVVARSPGEVITDGSQKPSNVYVTKSGIVALYLRIAKDRLLPLEVLGPGRMIDCRNIAEQAELLLVARALMPCELYRIPVASLQRGPLRDSETARTLLGQVERAQRVRLAAALVALDASEVRSPAQFCPVGRPTSFLSVMNGLTGHIHGTCLREFPCAAQQGDGCPMAGFPARESQPIWPLAQDPLERGSADPPPGYEGDSRPVMPLLPIAASGGG